VADNNESVMEDNNEATINTGYVMMQRQMRNMSRDTHNNQNANDFESDKDNEPKVPQGSDLDMGPDLPLAELLNNIVALKVSQLAYLDTEKLGVPVLVHRCYNSKNYMMKKAICITKLSLPVVFGERLPVVTCTCWLCFNY
jgi:hypothetical protein